MFYLFFFSFLFSRPWADSSSLGLSWAGLILPCLLLSSNRTKIVISSEGNAESLTLRPWVWAACIKTSLAREYFNRVGENLWSPWKRGHFLHHSVLLLSSCSHFRIPRLWFFLMVRTSNPHQELSWGTVLLSRCAVSESMVCNLASQTPLEPALGRKPGCS